MCDASKRAGDLFVCSATGVAAPPYVWAGSVTNVATEAFSVSALKETLQKHWRPPQLHVSVHAFWFCNASSMDKWTELQRGEGEKKHSSRLGVMSPVICLMSLEFSPLWCHIGQRYLFQVRSKQPQLGWPSEMVPVVERMNSQTWDRSWCFDRRL